MNVSPASLPPPGLPFDSIQMLFTWDTTNLCLVFPQWRVDGTLSLLLSLLGVVVLSAGYELMRDLTRRYETSSSEYLNRLPSKSLQVAQVYLFAVLSVSTLLWAWSAPKAPISDNPILKCSPPSADDDEQPHSWFARVGQSAAPAARRTKLVKAVLYAVQVFYSFFIM